MSRWIIDASLALGWYLKDEADRTYNLAVLAGLAENDAVVPFLWMYEVSNGLVSAHRRKRVKPEQIEEIVSSLRALPITIDQPDSKIVLGLPALALDHQLTAYDAAYLELALRLKLPIATKDEALKRAMKNGWNRQRRTLKFHNGHHGSRCRSQYAIPITVLSSGKIALQSLMSLR